jgi:hypothetical protein
MTSNYTKSSSVALKRKRGELDSHNDSLDRGHSGSSKIRELFNVKNIPQTQASDIQSDIAQATARLLPSGDFVSLSTTDITLIQDIFDPTNRKLISIPIEDCHIENLGRGLSVSVGFGNTRDVIACFDEGEYGTVLKFKQNPSHQNQNLTMIPSKLLFCCDNECFCTVLRCREHSADICGC